MLYLLLPWVSEFGVALNKKINRSVRENILLWITFTTSIGVLPFAIYRFSHNQFDIALMDGAISLLMLFLFAYIFKTRNVQFADKALISLALSGVALSTFLIGPTQVYWAFPATVATFYILNPRVGALLSSIFTVSFLCLLLPIMPPLQLLTLMVTLSITNLFAYVFATGMAKQRKQLLVLATVDPLTGAGNRRALKDKLDHVIASNHRNPGKVSLLLIDLDFFKKINDKFGHNTGDRYLTEITSIIKSRIRTVDSLFRFGGEEFIVIAENTDVNAANVLSEVLRTTVETSEIIPQTTVTISIGVAVIRVDETDEQWVKRADEALFKAKENGRNQVCFADPIDSKKRNRTKAS